jgi:hypothetical protein
MWEDGGYGNNSTGGSHTITVSRCFNRRWGAHCIKVKMHGHALALGITWTKNKVHTLGKTKNALGFTYYPLQLQLFTYYRCGFSSVDSVGTDKLTYRHRTGWPVPRVVNQAVCRLRTQNVFVTLLVL